jgi:hypothetical protein
MRRCYGVNKGGIGSRLLIVVHANSHSHYQYKKVVSGSKQPVLGIRESNYNFVAK